MRHCCKNCHFLVKEHRDPTGGIYRFSWNKRERSDLRVDEQYAANCFQGIWDTGVDPSLNKRLPEILNKQRRDDCFFIAPQEGMLFDAALELHKIRKSKKELSLYPNWPLDCRNRPDTEFSLFNSQRFLSQS